MMPGDPRLEVLRPQGQVQWLTGHPGESEPPLDLEAFVRRIVRDELTKSRQAAMGE